MSKVNDLQTEIAAQSLQIRCIVPEYGKWIELFYPLLRVFSFLCIGMYFICRRIYERPPKTAR